MSPSFEARVLETLNGYAGRSPYLDAPMRALTVFGVVPPAMVVIFAACCALEGWRRRGLWFALIGASLAFPAAVRLQAMLYRPRPFINHPVHLLVCYPTDDSFPSIQTAVTAALVSGLIVYGGRLRWLWIPYLLLAGIARVFSGIENPYDVLAAWLVGGVIALVTISVLDFDRLVRRRSVARRAVAASALIAVLAFGGMLFGLAIPRAEKPISRTPTEKHGAGIIRGLDPAAEKRLARVLLRKRFPGRITSIAVGASEFIRVAGIEFSGEGLRASEIEAQARSIESACFAACPDLAEVDVWAVRRSGVVYSTFRRAR